MVNSLQLLTPAIEDAAEYPVEPALWRRRGGLDAPLVPSTAPEPTASVSGRNTIQSAHGHVLGHKETIPPLLIAAVGSEPRADRWLNTNSRSGALVVPLYFE